MKFQFCIVVLLFIKIGFTQEPIHFSFWNKQFNPSFSIDEKNFSYISFENKFLLKEWNKKLFGYDKKTKKGRIHCLFAQRGNPNFSSNKASISYAQKMSPKLNLGLSLEYIFFQQSEIKDNPKLLSPNFGVSYKHSKLHSLYFSIFNSGINYHNNGLPNSLLIFWNYYLNDKYSFSTGCSTEKENLYLAYAFHYLHSKRFKFTLGVNSSERPIEFAFSCCFKEMEFLFQNNYHQILGFSNQIGIAYKW